MSLPYYLTSAALSHNLVEEKEPPQTTIPVRIPVPTPLYTEVIYSFLIFCDKVL
jgi:hypothetical protein